MQWGMYVRYVVSFISRRELEMLIATGLVYRYVPVAASQA